MKIDWKNFESSRKALRSLEDRKILFKDIIEETLKTSSFWLLIADVDAFKELKEKNLLNKEDFGEMFKHLKTSDDLDNFANILNTLYSLNIPLNSGESVSYRKKLFYLMMTEKTLIDEKDFKNLFDSIEVVDDFNNFSRCFSDFYELNTDFGREDAIENFVLPLVFEDLIEKSVVSFKEIVDKCASTLKYANKHTTDNSSCLEYLNLYIHKNYDSLKDFLKKNNSENFKYVFDASDRSELYYLLHAVPYVRCTDYLRDSMISFEEIVEKHKEINCLEWLLTRTVFFNDEVMTECKDNLRYLILSISRDEEAEALCSNNELFSFLLQNKIVTFRELTDVLAKTSFHKISHKFLATDDKLREFDECVRNNIIVDDDIRHLIDVASKDLIKGLSYFSVNSVLLVRSIENKIIEFRELVDRLSILENDYSAYIRLRGFLNNTTGLTYFIEKKLISNEDIQYLLNNIKLPSEVFDIGNHQKFLIKYCAENFLFDIQTTKILDDALNRRPAGGSLTCFTQYVGDKETLEAIHRIQLLIYLNGSDQEKQEVFDLLKNSEDARKKYSEIVDNNLIDQYTLQDLRDLLKAEVRKQKNVQI